MYKIILFTVFASQVLSSCTTTHQLPSDSNTQTHSQIEYISEPDSKFQKIGSIVIKQRGNRLDLERALPQLQKKAFEIYENTDVKIANITSSKREKEKIKSSLVDCNKIVTPQFQSKEDKLAYHLRNGPIKHCSNSSKLMLNSEYFLIVTADILN